MPPAARISDLTAHGGVITVGFPTVIIGGMPASRIGDMHVCPMVTGLVPHVGGPLVQGSFTVIVGGVPQSRIGDMLVCVGPPDVVVLGAPTVMVGDVGGAGGMGAMLGAALAGVFNLLAGYPKAVLQPDGSVVTQYSPGIFIRGTAAFQAKVIADLNKIKATPTGKKLLESIDNNKNGKSVTIESSTSGNVTGYSNPSDRFVKDDGKPGAGTSATVGYDPDTQKIGNEPWETRPPAIGLAHELVHAEQAGNGTMAKGMTDNDKKPDPADPTKTAQEKTREVEAAGIPPNDTREFHENKIRAEWDPPQPKREWY